MPFIKWKLCSNKENMVEEVYWKSNHKTSIIKIIFKKLQKIMLKVEKIEIFFNTSDCSKCREKGAPEEQSRKDTSSVCFENQREQQRPSLGLTSLNHLLEILSVKKNSKESITLEVIAGVEHSSVRNGRRFCYYSFLSNKS